MAGSIEENGRKTYKVIRFQEPKQKKRTNMKIHESKEIAKMYLST
jgi:hypothetical protein